MKLTIFSYGLWPEQFIINELATEFAKKGHLVEAYSGLPNYPKGEFFLNYSLLKGPYKEIHNNFSIVRYPVIPRKKGFKFLFLNYLSHQFFGLISLFRLKKSDCAFVFASSPLLTAILAIAYSKLRSNKAKKIPVIVWLQDIWPDSLFAVGAFSENNLIVKFVDIIVAWIYRNTDHVFIQSPAFAENLEKYNYKGKYTWVPNWAPMEQDLKKPETSPWLNKLPSGFNVTFAGNIGRGQNLGILIEAAEQLKNEEINFFIVGDGSDLDRLKSICENLHLSKVYFFGRKPIEDMDDLFSRSSALLVSLSDQKIFTMTIPSKVQSYMKAGKPIICSLSGAGAKIVVENKCGLESAPNDSKKLAGNISKLSRLDKSELKQMGDNAYQTYLTFFKADIVMNKIENLLQDMI